MIRLSQSLIYRVNTVHSTNAMKCIVRLFSEETQTKDMVITSPKLFAWNLSFDLDEITLTEHLQSVGPLKNARILKFEGSTRSRGIAQVEYEQLEDAKRAVETLNGTKLLNRRLYFKQHVESTSASDKQKSPMENKTKVFLSNVPLNTTWMDLKYFFDIAGVLHISSPGNGNALLLCNSKESANQAVDIVNTKTFKDCKLSSRIERVNARIKDDGNIIDFSGAEELPSRVKLYVGNLPWTANWADVKDLFKSVVPNPNAFVPMSEDKRSKGFAIVEVNNDDDAELAMKILDKYELMGRQITVKRFSSKMQE